jgi:hypothetical protein
MTTTTTTQPATTTCALCGTPIPAGQERPLDPDCIADLYADDDAVIGDCCDREHTTDCRAYRYGQEH